MKKQSKFFNPAASLLLASLSLAASHAAAGAVNLPFKASISTQEILLPGSELGLPCALVGMKIGIGQASHFGRVLLSATDCVQPYSNHFDFSNGKFTLTAANGDTVTAVYGGSLVATQNASIYAFSGSWFQITGGSGRFAGARGTGQVQGTEQLINNPPPAPPASTGKLDIIGTISY